MTRREIAIGVLAVGVAAPLGYLAGSSREPTTSPLATESRSGTDHIQAPNSPPGTDQDSNRANEPGTPVLPPPATVTTGSSNSPPSGAENAAKPEPDDVPTTGKPAESPPRLPADPDVVARYLDRMTPDAENSALWGVFHELSAYLRKYQATPACHELIRQKIDPRGPLTPNGDLLRLLRSDPSAEAKALCRAVAVQSTHGGLQGVGVEEFVRRADADDIEFMCAYVLEPRSTGARQAMLGGLPRKHSRAQELIYTLAKRTDDRAGVSMAIDRMAPSDAKARAVLLDLTHHADHAIRAQSIMLLHKGTGDKDDEVIRRMLELLESDPEANVRGAVIGRLSVWYRRDKPKRADIEQAIRAATKDPAPAVHRTASWMTQTWDRDW